MLLQASQLTFGEIMDRWARESADHPGALSHDRILERFFDALHNDEFSHARLKVWQHPKYVSPDNQTYVRQSGAWIVVTRDMLAQTLFRNRDEINMQVWLKDLQISKDEFGRWCDAHEYPRPKFWFQEDRQVRCGRPIGSTAKSLNQQAVYERFDEIVRAGQLRFEHRELTSLARKIAEETGYKPDTVRRKIVGSYRQLEEKSKSKNPHPSKRKAD